MLSSRYSQFFLLIAALFVALMGYPSYVSYQSAKTSAQANAQHLAGLLERDLLGNFEAAEHLGAALVAEIPAQAMHPEAVSRYQSQLSHWFQSHAQEMASAQALRVFDANGALLYSNRPQETRFNVADRPFFQSLQAHPASTTLYSDVLQDRGTGRRVLVMAQAIRDATGAFLGCASIGIDVSTLGEHVARIQVGEGGVVALRRLDNGAVLMRVPGPLDLTNTAAPDVPTRLAIPAGDTTGAAEFTSPLDGIHRVYGWRQLGQLPFTIVVGLAERDYLAPWRRDAALSAASALLFLLVLGLVFFRLSRADARRLTQEAQLRMSESRLRERERDLQAILNTLPSLIGYWDRDLRCRFGNHAYSSWFGIDPARLPGMPIREVIGEEPYRLNLPFMEAALRGETQQFERAIPSPDGTQVRHALAQYIPDLVDGKVLGFYVQVTDVTSVKQTEYLLREAQKLGGIGSFCLDIASGRWTSSEVLDVLFGIDANYPRSVAGWAQLIHPDERDEMLAYWQQTASDTSRFEREYRVVRASDAAVRWVYGLGNFVCNAQGQPVQFLGSIQDITARKLKDERLRKKVTAMQLRENALNQVSQGVVFTDAERRISYVNQAFASITGYTDKELLGQSCHFLQGPDSQSDVVRQLHAALDAQQAFHGEMLSYRKDGSTFWNDLSISPVVDAAGRLTQFVAVMRDITAKKQMIEKLELFGRVIAETDDIVIMTEAEPIDQPGPRIVFVNDAFERTTGYTREEAMGNTPRMLQGLQADRAPLDRIRQALKTWQPVREEVLNYTKDGRAFWSDLQIFPIANASGWYTHWIAIQRDITPRKQLMVDLVQAKAAAEAANTAKSQFLSTLSHELRTPMNGILGMAQVLQQPQVDDATRVDDARIIFTSGQALLTLLNDILDLSKIEAGKVELQMSAFEPAHLLDGLTVLFAEAAKAKGLQLTRSDFAPAGQRYLGDDHRLRQMLLNLVGNAIKFTAQGQVSIDARELERGDGLAVLEFAVTDTGIGIAPDQQAQLFEPFSQADSSTTRQFGGSGLGLSIVRRLARLMGGEAGLQSQPGQGSRFWFRVRVALVVAGVDTRQAERATMAPASQQAAVANDAPDADPAAHPAPAASKRILVVDDNPLNRRVIQALLGMLGYADVTQVEDGQQAVEAITRGDVFDVVLMDLNMPVLGGYEATEAIRSWEAQHGHRRTPIIALTADAYAEDSQRCLAGGMDDFLAKPVVMQQLTPILARWLA